MTPRRRRPEGGADNGVVIHKSPSALLPIWREGFPNPTVQKRDLRSLYSPKAERVLRVLLACGPRAWRTQALADAAQVSLGQVASVKRLLTDREWIACTEAGFTLAGYELGSPHGSGDGLGDGILLERSGQLVTREELRERLWGADTFVDFATGLTKAINGFGRHWKTPLKMPALSKQSASVVTAPSRRWIRREQWKLRIPGEGEQHSGLKPNSVPG